MKKLLRVVIIISVLLGLGWFGLRSIEPRGCPVDSSEGPFGPVARTYTEMKSSSLQYGEMERTIITTDYDRKGRITDSSSRSTFGPNSKSLVSTEQFHYNSRGELTSTIYYDESHIPQRWTTYSYDPVRRELEERVYFSRDRDNAKPQSRVDRIKAAFSGTRSRRLFSRTVSKLNSQNLVTESTEYDGHNKPRTRMTYIYDAKGHASQEKVLYFRTNTVAKYDVQTDNKRNYIKISEYEDGKMVSQILSSYKYDRFGNCIEFTMRQIDKINSKNGMSFTITAKTSIKYYDK
jgi:hypothetical protein